MKLLAAVAVFGLISASFGQGYTFPKSTSHSHKPQSHDSINRGLVNGFKNHPTNTTGNSHFGMHQERRHYPGHYGKDGHYIAEHWQTVWVKN